MSQKIFIYGVPGSGKTTYSLDLKSKTGFELIEADQLREVAQQYKSEQEDPFLYVGTTEVFKQFGDFTEGNIIKGLRAVRKSLALYVSREVDSHKGDLIIEGAFLDPSELEHKGEAILIICSDEEKHRAQYFRHREQNEKNLETFKAARIIQDYLVEEGEGFGVKIIENNFDFKPI